MQVAEFIRASGIQPGEAMPTEAALAARFHVGRPQVREALATLEGFGAVASRRGAHRQWLGVDAPLYMSRLTLLVANLEQSMVDLFEIRHAIETTVLPRAAARLTPDDIRYLRGLVGDMVAAADRGESFAARDEEFHRALLAPLGNAMLDALLHSYWTAFNAVRSAVEPTDERVVAARHGNILDAIEDGDTRRAVYELDVHFYGVKNRFPDIRLDAQTGADPLLQPT
jgi:DNA-binding FadR family transcriptional regulator